MTSPEDPHPKLELGHDTTNTLKETLLLIADPKDWCQGHFAVNERGEDCSINSGCRFCFAGALSLQCHFPRKPGAKPGCGAEYKAALKVIERAGAMLFPSHANKIIDINDVLGHYAVIAVLHKAIKLSEAA